MCVHTGSPPATSQPAGRPPWRRRPPSTRLPSPSPPVMFTGHGGAFVPERRLPPGTQYIEICILFYLCKNIGRCGIKSSFRKLWALRLGGAVSQGRGVSREVPPHPLHGTRRPRKVGGPAAGAAAWVGSKTPFSPALVPAGTWSTPATAPPSPAGLRADPRVPWPPPSWLP